MKKRIFSLLMALLVVMSLTVTAFADYEGKYVMDENGLLTIGQVEKLEEMAAECSESSGCGVYLVIVDDYQALTGEYYDHDAAVKIYEERNLGYGENKDGIMLMMSMNDRHLCLLSKGVGTDALSKSENEELRKSISRYFKDDEWYEGFSEYIEKAAGYLYLNTSKNSDYDYDSPVYSSYKLKSRLLGIGLCFVIGLVVALIVVFVLKAQLRSVAQETNAANYIDKDGLNLSKRYDRFTHRTRTRVYDPPSKSDSDSSSGGSSGYSSGGNDF